MAEKESFKVTDRRGRASEAGPAGPAAPPSAEPRPSSTRAPRAEPVDRSGVSGGGETGGPTLQGLFMMFASSALINLGEAADPGPGERRVDLKQARSAIDVVLLRLTTTST